MVGLAADHRAERDQRVVFAALRHGLQRQRPKPHHGAITDGLRAGNGGESPGAVLLRVIRPTVTLAQRRSIRKRPT